MSARPRVMQLRYELRKKERIIHMLNDRVDIQARYITTLEHKVAELADPPYSRGAEPQTAKAGTQ